MGKIRYYEASEKNFKIPALLITQLTQIALITRSDSISINSSVSATGFI